MVFLPLACTAGYCLWLKRRLRWPAATMPLFTLCTILFVLYVAALAGFLRPVTYVVLTSGLLLLLWSLLGHWRASLATLVVPGLAIWLIGGALLWPRLSTAAYSSRDEFSHWGRVSKEMYLRVVSSPSPETSLTGTIYTARSCCTSLWPRLPGTRRRRPTMPTISSCSPRSSASSNTWNGAVGGQSSLAFLSPTKRSSRSVSA
jgi:hypothetical protein